MDEQKYWRNIIAREIKAEHDRVKKFYSKRGVNSGGISAEEQTRLNIFALCQSIAETYNPDIPPVSDTPPKERKPRVKKEVVESHEEKPIPPKKSPPKPPALQNEFGEMI